MIPKTIEEIFPLTIVSPRYLGKSIIIFNSYSKFNGIPELEESEEAALDINNWLDENVTCDYGIGITIWDAFENYRNKLINKK